MSARIWIVMAAGLVMAADVEIFAQRTRGGSFQPDTRIFSRLFTGPRVRIRRPAEVPTAVRERRANRHCDGCADSAGTTHVLLDSPRLTDGWLAHHTTQANGGSFGDNVAVADFWYDAVHRRVFSRSLVLHEVDDPADLRLGRAPGRYPNGLDFGGTVDEGTTVGHVGFVTWTHNGFGAYFAAIQGAIRDSASGYLDLATATGAPGRTRSDSTYEPEELVKHVRLHPAGQLEIGFDTDPAARPDTSLLVRGHARVAGALTADRIETPALTIDGGNVPHACSMKSATGTRRDASVSCDANQIALGGGGACVSGELRASRPTQSGAVPDGWALTCSSNGTHTAYVICCSR